VPCCMLSVIVGIADVAELLNPFTCEPNNMIFNVIWFRLDLFMIYWHSFLYFVYFIIFLVLIFDLVLNFALLYSHSRVPFIHADLLVLPDVICSLHERAYFRWTIRLRIECAGLKQCLFAVRPTSHVPRV